MTKRSAIRNDDAERIKVEMRERLREEVDGLGPSSRSSCEGKWGDVEQAEWAEAVDAGHGAGQRRAPSRSRSRSRSRLAGGVRLVTIPQNRRANLVRHGGNMNLTKHLDAVLEQLDAALAGATIYEAKVATLRRVARVPLSPEAASELEAALAAHDATLSKLSAARAKVATVRAALDELRHELAALQAAPATLPTRMVSSAIAAEFAALTADLAGAVALFRAAPEQSAA